MTQSEYEFCLISKFKITHRVLCKETGRYFYGAFALDCMFPRFEDLECPSDKCGVLIVRTWCEDEIFSFSPSVSIEEFLKLASFHLDYDGLVYRAGMGK